MKLTNSIEQKLVTLPQLLALAAGWRVLGKKISFTNGVFDLLHQGHLFALTEAAKQADLLVVAVNSDSSVKKLKGDKRPIQPEATRSRILAHLLIVDAVIVFSDDTPRDIIAALLPDVLVKGGDYKVEEIAGAKEVLANGGTVVLNTLVDGISTTKIIDQLSQ